MSAETLRKAAEKLRALADAATQPDEMFPWGDKTLPALDLSQHGDATRGYLGGTWGDYYATMHPGVGLALADWLDACGEFMEDNPGYTHDGEDFALRIARLILGGAS